MRTLRTATANRWQSACLRRQPCLPSGEIPHLPTVGWGVVIQNAFRLATKPVGFQWIWSNPAELKAASAFRQEARVNNFIRNCKYIPAIANAFRQVAHGSSLSQEQGLEIPIIANAFRLVCL